MKIKTHHNLGNTTIAVLRKEIYNTKHKKDLKSMIFGSTLRFQKKSKLNPSKKEIVKVRLKQTNKINRNNQ